MNKMKMWPTSNNQIIKPQKIRKLRRRQGKVRKKEVDGSRNTRMLSNRGAVMTHSKCGIQGHKKRGCPTRNKDGPSQSTKSCSQVTTTGPSQSAEPSSQKEVILLVTLKSMLYVYVYVVEERNRRSNNRKSMAEVLQLNHLEMQQTQR